MLIPIGTRVKFRHSQEEGVITEVIDDRMVSVYVAAWDMDIPVGIDDLLIADPSQIPGYKAGKKKQPPAAEPSKTPPTTQEHGKGLRKAAAEGSGILLAFDPILKSDATPEKFRVLLLNDTPFDVIFNLELFVLDAKRFSKNGKLSSGNWIDLGMLLFDELNDFPAVEAECWRITTDGTGGKQVKDLRIKPKVFFGRLQPTPFLGRPTHLFPLFENLQGLRQEGPKEDLRAYTKEKTPHPAILKAIADDKEITHEVREAAEFLPELDLHIEKLVNDPAHLSNAQIAQLQLKVFEDYMDKAIRLGLERVFIIHGLGKGRLKDMIASRLIRMPEVLTFKNEFHPKYGHGATEVIFI
ncbi:MAG: Smr/MutS family protein [Haliscomenobacter sp.]|nr:Smr/MutS family protein [Haliscomenobacter sp.]